MAAVLDALDPAPAFVIGPSGDIVAWNAAWAAVAAGLGLLDASAGRAQSRALRVHPPGGGTVFPEWRVEADEQAARMRRAATFWAHHAAVPVLVDELRLDSEFETRWNAHPVGEKRRGTKRLTHPVAGDLVFDYEVLELGDDSGLELVTWLASGLVSADRVQGLIGPPRTAARRGWLITGGGERASRVGLHGGHCRRLGWGERGRRALRRPRRHPHLE